MALKFCSGTVGSLNVSMLTCPRNRKGSVTIIGEHGTVKLCRIAMNKFEKWEFEDCDDEDRLVE